MSELVEDYLEFSSNYDFFQQSAPTQSPQLILECFARKICNHQNQSTEIKIEQMDKMRQVLSMFTFLKLPSAIYEYVFRIRVDFRHKKLDLQINFLQAQNKFPKVPSPIRKSLCRKLVKINKQLCKNGSKLILNMQTGSLTLFNSLDETEEIFKSSHLIWNRIKNKISEVVKIMNVFQKQFAQLISKEDYKRFCMGNLSEETQKLKKKQFQFTRLVRQVAMSHIKLDFKDKQQIDINPVLTNGNSHQQNMMIRLFSNMKNDVAFIETHKIYSQQVSKLLDIVIKDLKIDIDPKLQAQYASYLKTPVPKDPSSGENKFIFNQIQVVRPQSVKLNSTPKEGGLNKIYVQKITFYYSSSDPITQNEQITPFYKGVTYVNQEGVTELINPILTKILAIKVPKNQGRQKKYDNEFNIIRTFKNGVSAYILKYYRSEQTNFEYRKCLLMDFLPNAQPLSNFIQIFRQTLSLNSKLYLIVNISNGLRFIDDYKVVHMDLSLNNILVCKDYLTKLIDFGEAFSQKVKSSQGNSFKRGYTMPFCSPEQFARKESFTMKQDVFSLGIIMYRIIFGDYPFFSSNELLKCYKDKSYPKKILLAPERGEDFGDMETINLIYRIIFRCLNEDEQVRCEPSWITIFLKLIYYFLV